MAWASAFLLVMEIVRTNVSATQRHDWPWNMEFVGAPTAALVLVASLIALLARDQYARSVGPALRYVSQWVADAPGLARSANRYRQVIIRNAGNGAAVLTGLAWRVRTSSGETEHTSLNTLRNALDDADLMDGADYTITNYSSGTVLAPGEERLYFECTEDALTKFDVFDVRFEFESLLGDRYARTISLLPRPGASEALTLRPEDVWA